MPVGSGGPWIHRPTKDPDKRTPPNSIVKFGLLIEEIDMATEEIATLRKVPYFLLQMFMHFFMTDLCSTFNRQEG